MYTRSQLEVLKLPGANRDQKVNAMNVLVEALQNELPLTMAERAWICFHLEILHPTEDENVTLDPFDFDCREALFRNRYILYFNNVLGWYPVKDYKGVIEGPEKQRDLDMLEQHYDAWQTVTSIQNHQDSLLQNISTETRHHILLIERFCKKTFSGGNRRDYLVRSIILHSEYMYYMIKEYYEENDFEIHLEISNQNIVIDSFSYVHIMFRHYAQLIKEYQVGKSYHIVGLDYKNLPSELRRIILGYQATGADFDGQKIYFKHNDNLYVIWFRPILKSMPGNRQVMQLRVQTLYPIENGAERHKATMLFPKEEIGQEFTYLIP